MNASSYQDLIQHFGHDVEVVFYGSKKKPDNVAIECSSCGEVLMNFDRPKRPRSKTVSDKFTVARTWRVRVYVAEKMIQTWTIENRTEREAEREAMFEIERMDPTPDDWTLTKEKKQCRTGARTRSRSQGPTSRPR